MDPKETESPRKLAIAIVDRANDTERDLLLRWANELVNIKNAPLSKTEKMKRAIKATSESKAILPLLKMAGREIKEHGWDRRGLPARIGLSAGAFAAVVLSGHGAGIAALGGAIGVPLWVVFGAGGAFAGVLIEELQQSKRKGPRDDHHG